MARLAIVDQQFHRMYVIEFAYVKNQRTYWRCRCDCGVIKIACGKDLISDKIKSCGCLNQEAREAFLQSIIIPEKQWFPSEYAAWGAMKTRCYNPNIREYDRYGGRGVKVCDEWLNSFPAFLADVGPKPSPKHTLDRFPDKDGDYRLGNVRWATRLEQSNNLSTNKVIMFQGIEYSSLEMLYRAFGQPRDRVRTRIKQGWSLERALLTPKTR